MTAIETSVVCDAGVLCRTGSALDESSRDRETTFHVGGDEPREDRRVIQRLSEALMQLLGAIRVAANKPLCPAGAPLTLAGNECPTPPLPRTARVLSQRTGGGVYGRASVSREASCDEQRQEQMWGLVRRAQDGDPEAFGAIYDAYVDVVYRYIVYRVGTRHLAEDLTSDVFLRALRRIDSVTWQGRDLGAWLVTIARNLIADYYKSSRYRMEYPISEMLDADREDRSLRAHPESATIQHLTHETLLGALKKLNSDQQECLVLRFLQGMSVAETAKIMGKNEGAIKALQYRAVRSMGRMLPESFLR